MNEDKRKAAAQAQSGSSEGAPSSASSSLFWWGIAAGVLITAVIFYRQVLGVLRDAAKNILPLVFSPGILEVSIAVVGFGLVIVINHFLRREREDEWVVLEDPSSAEERGEE